MARSSMASARRGRGEGFWWDRTFYQFMVKGTVTEKPPPLVQVNLPKLEGLAGIKMGPGVLGRATTVCIALAALGAATAVPLAFINFWASLAAMGMTIVSIIYVMQKAFSHSDRHPDQALLEGSQLLAKHRLDQRAKNPSVIEGSTIAVANVTPPKAIASEGGPHE